MSEWGEGLLDALISNNLKAVQECVEERGIDPDIVLFEAGGRAIDYAVEHNQLEIISFLLSKGVDPNGGTDRPTLIYAAAANKLEAAKLLIEAGADVNARNSSEDGRFTPLIANAKNHGNVDFLRLLIENGANLDDVNKHGYTALAGASSEGSYEAVEYLLSVGANIESEKEEETTPLLAACIYGDLEVAKLLLEKGANIEARNYDRLTPFLAAVAFEHADIANLLIDYGANIHVESCFGLSGICYANNRGLTEIEAKLRSKGCRISDSTKYKLIKAVESDDIDEVERILSEGKCDASGYLLGYETPLIAAIKQGSYAMTENLLRHGANVNENSNKNFPGFFPLDIAIQENDHKTVKLLIENGASVETKKYGPSVVETAITYASAEILQTLITAGAQIDGKTLTSKETMLSYAIQGGRTEHAEVLLKNSVDVNITNDDGSTALYYAHKAGNKELADKILDLSSEETTNISIDKYKEEQFIEACRTGDLERVIELIERGVNVNCKGSFNLNPLSLAVNGDHKDIARLLLKNGAQVEIGIFDPPSDVCSSGDVEMLNILIEGGVDISKFGSSIEMPIVKAIKKEHFEIVETLIENGFNLDRKDLNGKTPLYHALMKGNQKMINLISSNCSQETIEETNKELSNIKFYKAAGKGDIDEMKRLIEEGAKVVPEGNAIYYSPMTEAMLNGKADAVKLLVENGAKVSRYSGITLQDFLMNACKEGFADIVEIIIDAGEDIINGYPISEAAKHNNLDIVTLLVEAGVDPNISDEHNKTPLNYATEYQAKDVAKYLLSLDIGKSQGREI